METFSQIPEELVVAQIAADRRHPTSAPHRPPGELLGAVLLLLYPLSDSLAATAGTDPTAAQFTRALRAHRHGLVRLGSVLVDLVTAIDHSRPEPDAGDEQDLYRRLVGAAVRATDRRAVDRGFEIADAFDAWDLVRFSCAGLVESGSRALSQGHSKSADEAYLQAVDAATALIVALAASMWADAETPYE